MFAPSLSYPVIIGASWTMAALKLSPPLRCHACCACRMATKHQATFWFTSFVRYCSTAIRYWIAQRNDRNEVVALHWTDPRGCQVREIGVEGAAFKEVFYELGDNPLIDMPDNTQLVIPGARCVSCEAGHAAPSADR